MAHKLKPKISVSEELLSISGYDKEFQGNNKPFSNSFNHDPYEVFRNNTTAVEVIVKEIKHKGKGKIITNTQRANVTGATVCKLNKDIEKLRSQLQEANSNLQEARECFKLILCEMKKQLDAANQRELKTQTMNLVLQLEKEKLGTLLDSKSNLVAKLRKELISIKEMLKVAVKFIRCTPPCPEIICNSDAEYEEFEKDLITSAFIVIPRNCSAKESSLENFKTRNNVD